MSTATAQPSACGPSASQRKSGTPSSRSRLRALGIVQMPRSVTGFLSVVAAIAAPYQITLSYSAGTVRPSCTGGAVRVAIDPAEGHPAGIPRNIPEAQLRAAVAGSRSWRGVLRALGYTSPRLGRELREASDRLQLDYSHFGPDEAELARAVSSSTTWSEVIRELGYAAGSGSARATVRRRCARAGVDISHLETDLAVPLASAVSLAPSADRL